jgi:hypothetical protein
MTIMTTNMTITMVIMTMSIATARITVTIATGPEKKGAKAMDRG